MRGSRVCCAALFLAVAACDGGPSQPERLPPLSAGVWHVHGADGQELPALVAHGLVNGVLQQTFLDSARLSILAGGRWEQTMFLQTWTAGEYTASTPRLDHGSWTRSDSGYVFISDVHGPRHLIRDPLADSLSLMLRAEGVPGVTIAVLRRQPPPPVLTGSWTAAAVRDQPVPAVLYLFDPDSVNGREVSVHLVMDSARLIIRHNGQYQHRSWVTEWHGAVGGPPQTIIARLWHGDFGSWSRAGSGLALESGWLQNHRMTGTFDGGVVRLEHGFVPGDPVVPVRYARSH